MNENNYWGIRRTLAKIIKGTQWENHLFLVGGCVRDQIMKVPVSDVDIAVDLPNGGILFALWVYQNRLAAKGRKPQIFEHFGTAKVRLRQFPYDIIDCVQTRKTKYQYDEDPKPEEYFGTVLEDAICRDLTINSLFINVSTGELSDPTGYGLPDIKNHVIRTPNDPDITFTDNALHILRCIRFAVKYGWELNPELIESMKRNVTIVAECSTKRMLKEVHNIICLKDQQRAMALIEEVGAMVYVKPYYDALISKRKAKQERTNKKESQKETVNKDHRNKDAVKKDYRKRGAGKRDVPQREEQGESRKKRKRRYRHQKPATEVS